MRILERVICFLLICSIPIQLGKHFWPDSAFVSGIRVDYLSPTLFFTDILLFVLLGIVALNIWKEKKIPSKFTVILLCFTLISLGSFFRSEFPQTFLYSYVRICACICFGYVVARNTTESFLRQVSIGLGSVCVLVVLMELAQFINQGSIGGVFYWAGERNFSLSTPGIALFTLNGHLLLRPYATFPHPNVLAWYVFISLVCVRYVIFISKTTKQRTLFTIGYVLIGIGLFFTFSRVLIFSALSLLAIDAFSRRRALFVFVCAGLFMAVFHSRFISKHIFLDLIERIHFALPVINLGYDHSLFGLGLNQYFYHQIEVQHELSPFFLQPVHNSYFVIFLQTGILGLGTIIISVVLSFRRIFRLDVSYERELFFLLLTTLLFAALFDHYFVTLHQGMLLTAFVTGLVWSSVFSVRE